MATTLVLRILELIAARYGLSQLALWHERDDGFVGRMVVGDRETVLPVFQSHHSLLRRLQSGPIQLDELGEQAEMPALKSIFGGSPTVKFDPILRDGALVAFVLSRCSDDLADACELISQITRMAELATVMERELRSAREVQESLFPTTLPAVPGLDIAPKFSPYWSVGGDYYDVMKLDDAYGFIVADASGKGVSAALMVSHLRALLRAALMRSATQVDMGALVTKLNQLAVEATPESRYLTLFYAQFDPRRSAFDFVNAGHNAPVIVRARYGRPTLKLAATGRPLGLLRDSTYSQGQLRLEPGDILAAFSDGLVEARNRQGTEWTEEGLLNALLQVPIGETAAETAELVWSQFLAFLDGIRPHDDVTLLIVTAV